MNGKSGHQCMNFKEDIKAYEAVKWSRSFTMNHWTLSEFRKLKDWEKAT